MKIMKIIDDFVTQIAHSLSTLSTLSLSILTQINQFNIASNKIKTEISKELDECVEENFSDSPKDRDSNSSDVKMQISNE